MLQQYVGSLVRVVKRDSGLMVRVHGKLCCHDSMYYVDFDVGTIEFSASQVAKIVPDPLPEGSSLIVTTIELA